ncbi:MAG: G1 family glutamic endopeptidase [Anaerolineae bacterium]
MSEVSGQYGAKGTFNVRFNTTGHQATWIRLGGMNQVFQAGIDGMDLGGGQRWARIEFFPAPPNYYFTVEQNDVINVSAGRDLYTGYWVAIILDVTSGLYASEAYENVTERTGAWIVEKVGDQLGTFGTIQFSNCKWWDASGTLHNISQGTGYCYRTYIRSPGGTEVWPSTLTGGNAFTITRN